ncbi:hypothetical protein [Litoribrevibacter albus]|uniref:Uncharacterized protein n=1 Tax=Litoribrevibacter albus TaxID=1473156 RepID=A0AA37W8Z7_9GAMM|nr:hypothetical protein [Litoribrevibacter albus]GLQ32998.1 hypothetical protein GCM10007876_34770 [Litoribrevibacter albus]
MKQWVHRKSLVIFWLTLSSYLITLFFASYVGVYLTYVAVPVIVVTGSLAWFSRSNEYSNFIGEIEEELQIDKINGLLKKKEDVNSLDISNEEKLELKAMLDAKIQVLVSGSKSPRS